MKMNVHTPPVPSRFKNRNNREWHWLATIFAGLLLTQSAFAAVEYWDTSTASGLQNGSGTWDNGTTSLWSTSAAPIADTPLSTWTNGNDAAITMSGANDITLNGTIIVGTLTNSTAVTTLSSGVLQTSFIQVNSGTLTINSGLTLVSTGNRSSVTGSGNLIINGDIGEVTAGTTLRIFGTNTTLGGSGSTFSGGVQIYNGAALSVTHVNALGTGTALLFGQGGANGYNETLSVNLATNGTITKNLIFTGNNSGSGTNRASINSNGAGAVTFSGNMLFNSQVGSSGLYGQIGNLTLNLAGVSTANNIFATVIKDSGTGTNITSFVKSGTGKWILTGANTYTGGTSVTAGTLGTDVTGSFGTGDVNVSDNAILTLGNNASIGNSSTLTFTSLAGVGLNFTGTEVLGSLFDSTTSTYMAVGTWTATDLNNFFGGSVFSGTGLLNVTSVPEANACVLLLAGMGLLVIGQRLCKRSPASVL